MLGGLRGDPPSGPLSLPRAFLHIRGHLKAGRAGGTRKWGGGGGPKLLRRLTPIPAGSGATGGATHPRAATVTHGENNGGLSSPCPGRVRRGLTSPPQAPRLSPEIAMVPALRRDLSPWGFRLRLRAVGIPSCPQSPGKMCLGEWDGVRHGEWGDGGSWGVQES